MDIERLWLFLPHLVSTSAINAALLYCASGIGHTLGLRFASNSQLRTLGGQYLAGSLVYLAVLTAAGLVGLPGKLAIPLVLSLVLVGLCATVATRTARESLLAGRLAVAVLLGVSMGLCGAVGSTPASVDAYHYAAGASRLFQDEWARLVAASGMDTGPLESVAQLISYSRMAALGLLWPQTLAGIGVTIEDVHRIALWLYLCAGIVLVDLFPGRLPLSMRIVLAMGGIGLFNLRAVAASQVNQAAAVVIALILVWLWHWLPHQRIQLPLLIVGSYVITIGYPEFLMALPLYVLVMALIRSTSLLEWAFGSAAIGSGVSLAIIASHFQIITYLLGQTTQSVGFPMMAARPDNPLAIWTALLLRDAGPVMLLVWFAPITLLLLWWRPMPAVSAAAVHPLALVAWLGGIGSLYTWVLLRSPSMLYAISKLGGWIGPALILLAWLLLVRVRWPLTVLGLGMVLALAATRAAGFPHGLDPYLPPGPNAAILAPRVLFSKLDPCIVELPSNNPQVILRGVAESAAPSRGCLLTVSPARETAAAYDERPPSRWRAGVPQRYVMKLWNASMERWEPTGAAAVAVGVRFTPVLRTESDFELRPIPQAVEPGVWVTVPMMVTPPAMPGPYILEHRVVKGQQWAAQALLTSVTVAAAE